MEMGQVGVQYFSDGDSGFRWVLVFPALKRCQDHTFAVANCHSANHSIDSFSSSDSQDLKV